MSKNKSNEEKIQEIIDSLNQQVIRARQTANFSGKLADFDFGTSDKKIKNIVEKLQIDEVFGSVILLLSNLEVMNKIAKDLGKDLGNNKIKLINQMVAKAELLIAEIKLNLNSEYTGSVN